MSLSQESLDQLYVKAHTEHGFTSDAVPQELLDKALELAYLAPTSYNCSPMRVIWVSSAEGKAKLIDAIKEYAPGNVKQTTEAPVTAIVCYNQDYEKDLPYLMPFVPNVADIFAKDGQVHDAAGPLNSGLQGGYLITALRAVGLNVGPEITLPTVDAAFLQSNEETKAWKSMFLINIGTGVPENRYPRAPRLTMEMATKKM
jgi:3-hydroxypropanoate dehydrogenase